MEYAYDRIKEGCFCITIAVNHASGRKPIVLFHIVTDRFSQRMAFKSENGFLTNICLDFSGHSLKAQLESGIL
jgi:hypothetical protein